MAKSILVPIDFSDVTEAVLARAAELGRALGARLRLLHVAAPEPDFVGFEVGPDSVRHSVAKELREDHRALQAHQDALRAQGLDATALLVPGSGAEKILEEAEQLGADMIVIGSHGHGALHALLVGSVCKGVLHGASCPVLVVPHPRSGGKAPGGTSAEG